MIKIKLNARDLIHEIYEIRYLEYRIEKFLIMITVNKRKLN